MKSIILIQHAQSEHHVNDLTGGWTDTALTDLGRRQAASIASRLAGELANTPCQIYSSDLKRAFETAEIVGSTLGVTPIPAPELRERNNGIATGKTKKWAQENASEGDWSLFDYRPFPQAETWREFHTRVSSYMDGFMSDHEWECVPVLVTHGGTLSNIVAWWLHLELDVLPERTAFHASPASISVLKENEFGNHELAILNDTAHLYADGLPGRPKLATG